MALLECEEMEEGRVGFLGERMAFWEAHQLHLTLGWQERDCDPGSHFMKLSRYGSGGPEAGERGESE